MLRYLKGEHIQEGPAFFLPGFNLYFRPHEVTLWFGYTGHGKSMAIQNQIASLIGQGRMALIASFEQPADHTLGAILMAYVAYPTLPYTDWFKPAYQFVNLLRGVPDDPPRDRISRVRMPHDQRRKGRIVRGCRVIHPGNGFEWIVMETHHHLAGETGADGALVIGP